jgi:hypothetical protein
MSSLFCRDTCTSSTIVPKYAHELIDRNSLRHMSHGPMLEMLTFLSIHHELLMSSVGNIDKSPANTPGRKTCVKETDKSRIFVFFFERQAMYVCSYMNS